MFMPFARLIAIYIIVGLAITAFFQRDAIIALIESQQEEVPVIRVSDIISAQEAAQPAPVAAPEVTQPVATPPAPVAPVYAPSEVTEAGAPASLEDRIDAARDAFWKGEGDKAEALYTSLVADYPAEASLAGELGNLYYNSGRIDMAAQMYYTVGLLALEAGNSAQAMSMIGVLQSIAPDMAADLRERASQ